VILGVLIFVVIFVVIPFTTPAPPTTTTVNPIVDTRTMAERNADYRECIALAQPSAEAVELERELAKALKDLPGWQDRAPVRHAERALRAAEVQATCRLLGGLSSQ